LGLWLGLPFSALDQWIVLLLLSVRFGIANGPQRKFNLWSAAYYDHYHYNDHYHYHRGLFRGLYSTDL
jgi:hypothetical protein